MGSWQLRQTGGKMRLAAARSGTFAIANAAATMPRLRRLGPPAVSVSVLDVALVIAAPWLQIVALLNNVDAV